MRYDSVIINDGNGNESDDNGTIPLFARLLALFVVQDDKSKPGVPLALVLPYDGKVSRAQRRKDVKLGNFYRVQPKARNAKPEVIFARSIIRGAVLVSTYKDQESYFVFDVLDSDMFLRISSILKNTL